MQFDCGYLRGWQLLQQQCKKIPQQFAAVKDDDQAAHKIDDLQQVGAELAAKFGYQQGQAGKPQAGGQCHPCNKWGGLGCRQCYMKGAQHHGAVDNGLWIKPGDYAGGGNHCAPGLGLPGLVQVGRLGAQQADADVQHNQAAHQQNQHLQPSVTLHNGADAKETGQRQCNVKKYDNGSGAKGARA